MKITAVFEDHEDDDEDEHPESYFQSVTINSGRFGCSSSLEHVIKSMQQLMAATAFSQSWLLSELIHEELTNEFDNSLFIKHLKKSTRKLLLEELQNVISEYDT